MKNPDINIFSLNDVLHTLRECDRNARYEGMFEQMLTFASELTGISEDALVGSLYQNREKTINIELDIDSDTDRTRNPRLASLRDYGKNEERLKMAAEKQANEKREFLISKIRSLAPRIDELITTGNACLQNKIPLTGQAFGMREGYDTNQFFTNSWSHLVGFAGNPHLQPCHIEFLGINGGGACGVYNFRTNGIDVFSVHEKTPNDIVEPSIGHMERFLNSFDTFEASFMHTWILSLINSENLLISLFLLHRRNLTDNHLPLLIKIFIILNYKIAKEWSMIMGQIQELCKRSGSALYGA